MRVIRAKTKDDLLNEIKELGAHDMEVYVNLRPTADIVEAIVGINPDVKKITCPPSLYRQTSRKVFKFAGDAGIRVEAGDFKVGRPKKYDRDTVLQIVNHRTSGKPAKKISEEMDIPLRTVYFYIRNGFQE